MREIFNVVVLSVGLAVLLKYIWAIRFRFETEHYGSLSEFLIGAGAILFGVVSMFVALDLRKLQHTQREDAALDRVAATLQWWRSQEFKEVKALHALADKDEYATVG